MDYFQCRCWDDLPLYGAGIGVGVGVLQIITAPNPRAQWQAGWQTAGSLAGGWFFGAVINIIPGAQVWSTYFGALGGAWFGGMVGSWAGGYAYDLYYGD